MIDTEIQSMLKESLLGYLRNDYTFENRRKFIDSEAGYSRDHWALYAELGWLQVAIPLECGGLGCGASEVLTVMQQFGRGNVASPFLASSIVGTKLIEAGAGEPLRTELLEQLGEGKQLVCLANYEVQSRYDVFNVQATAKHEKNQFILNGRKISVPYGNVADKFVVLMRTRGESTVKDGLSLFLVPRDLQGLNIQDFRTHDGGRVSTLEFCNAAVPEEALIGTENNALDILEPVLNLAVASVCSEMTGAMWKLFEATLEYLKTRSQFDSAIGNFQAVQHRMVDMYMRCELAQSLVMDTARAIDEMNCAKQSKMTSAAKWRIGKSAVHVAEEAVHLHGAMGMMDELPVGHYLKRITTLNLQFGDPAYHQNRYRFLCCN